MSRSFLNSGTLIVIIFLEDTTGGGVPQSLREKSDAIVQVNPLLGVLTLYYSRYLT
jgi:hypothetical protein